MNTHSQLKNLILAALFFGIGASAPPFDRSDSRDRFHALSHAHPRPALRVLLRLALGAGSGPHRTSISFPAVRNASHIPHSPMYEPGACHLWCRFSLTVSNASSKNCFCLCVPTGSYDCRSSDLGRRPFSMHRAKPLSLWSFRLFCWSCHHSNSRNYCSADFGPGFGACSKTTKHNIPGKH